MNQATQINPFRGNRSLVSEAQENSNDDFSAERYRGYLKLLAASGLNVRIRRKVDASDIVQQTLMQAHQARKEFRGHTEAEWLAWLRAILTRNLINVSRDLHRDKRNIDLEQSVANSINASSMNLEQWLAGNELTPSQNLLRSERLLQLCAAMEALPDDQREAIRLHYCEKLKLKEISEHMQRSVGSIAGLLKRGMGELRRQLANEEGDE